MLSLLDLVMHSNTQIDVNRWIVCAAVETLAYLPLQEEDLAVMVP